MTVTATPPLASLDVPTADASAHAGAGAIGEAQALAELQAVAAGMARFNALAAAAGAWSAQGRHHILALLDRVVDGTTTSRAGILVAEQRSGAWEGTGDRSFGAWRARTSRAGDRAACAQVRQAEELATVPQITEAVMAGRLGLEHAAVIAKVVATGTSTQREAMTSPEGQEELLALAGEVDAGAFAGAVSRWAATVDPPALEADHQAQRRERFLTVSDTPRGAFIKGRLDRRAGHRLTLALEALTPRPAKDDDRDAGQRAADALATMAESILAADNKPGAHVPPQVSLIMTEETFAGARAHRDRQRSQAAEGARAGDPSATPGASATTAQYPPATSEDGTPVPISELALVLCDCDVTRIAVDADGVPVDLGRTQRLFSGEQRRAVLARDRECIWPSCHMPARWCQIHHLRWWQRDGGRTSVDEGAAVCTYHHGEIHRRDLAVTRHLIPAEPSDTGPPTGGRDSGGDTRQPEKGGPPGSGAAGNGPPAALRRGRRSRLLAAGRYEFRDPSGRLLGEPPPPAGLAGTAPPPADLAGTASPSADSEDLEWITDPVTGIRVPTVLVPG